MADEHPDRPEHSPRGYEWLPDVYKRDIEALGPEARECARQVLVEGEIDAILRTPLGGAGSIRVPPDGAC